MVLDRVWWLGKASFYIPENVQNSLPGNRDQDKRRMRDLGGRDRWDGKTLWKLLVSNYLNISSEAFECPYQGH